MKLRARFYTIAGAAAELGLSKWMLLNLEKTGRIPPARRDPVNGLYRVYDDADIERIGQAIDNLNAIDTRIPA